MKTINWNQTREGNAHVSDGVEGYWATVPRSWTAQRVLDEFLSTADYTEATASFDVTAEILTGLHEGDLATRRVNPG